MIVLRSSIDAALLAVPRVSDEVPGAHHGNNIHHGCDRASLSCHRGLLSAEERAQLLAVIQLAFDGRFGGERFAGSLSPMEHCSLPRSEPSCWL